jgi:hypothetical protein
MKTVRKKRLLNNITKKNRLGKGREGTVYNAVNSHGIQYALKEGPLGPYEIEFAEHVAHKYPDQFMTLYDHRKGVALWSKVDTTLQEKAKHLSPSILYDIYIQIFNILTILQTEGWTHNDFYASNIGIRATPHSTITIRNHTIPTHGYLVQAIDYGLVRKEFQPGRDIYKLFSIVKENGVDTDLYRIKKVKLHKKYYLPLPKFIQMDLSVLLLHLMAAKEFKKIYPALHISYPLPTSAMLYILHHIKDPVACLNYLIEKRKT